MLRLRFNRPILPKKSSVESHEGILCDTPLLAEEPARQRHVFCAKLSDMELNAVELRVLGSLMEKEMTTPEAYPLSLNSLLAACNQKSSREPVMNLEEDEVRQALHGLEDRGWTAVVREGRVPRFEHRIRTVLQLRRDETAILCLLLLRGPQTVGELRGRADRMYSFDDLQSVTSALERMASRPAIAMEPGATGPLVVLLPRQAGSREARYMHLLGGPVDAAAYQPEERRQTTVRPEPGLKEELEALRQLCVQLQQRLSALETQVAAIQADDMQGRQPPVDLS